MFQTPIQNIEISTLENCGSEQLLGIFESCMRVKIKKGDYNKLSDVWGILFSKVYLSTEEMVDEMQRGKHILGEDKERILREFIKTDCVSEGAFVLTVIKNGGKIDRAALIMIADLENISGLVHDGTTALHLLTDACDKKVRPELIGRAGKNLLSIVYDSRGLPVLFTIFNLSDLCMQDLDAIAKVFSKDELRRVMNRNRTGKNALEVFTDAHMRLKSHAPSERNKFFVPHAVKSTNMGGDLRTQVRSHDPNKGASGVQDQPRDGKKKRKGMDGA